MELNTAMNLNPKTQFAVQLVGPGQLVLNTDKPVPTPGPHQVLAKVEAVGLCFSDMKLLKQFDQHVRKSEVLSGINQEVLSEIPTYVPGAKPTVPGHEVCCTVVAVGDQVKHYCVGQRWIVQADYRVLKTAGSNGAFGYNFEGGLQEYILLDERIIGDPADEFAYMIPVDASRSASQLALVEPWACVENSYVTPERNTLKQGGRCLVVADGGAAVQVASVLSKARPAVIEAYLGRSQQRTLEGDAIDASVRVLELPNIDDLEDEAYDDILYFGSHPEVIEHLNSKLAKGGIFNLILGGSTVGREVEIGVGRIHYGGTRWVGTVGNDPADGYAMIPATGEVESGKSVLVVGAGGPMGQMHVLRSLATDGVRVVASDVDAVRLETLTAKVPDLSRYDGVLANELDPAAKFDCVALMAPVPALLVDAIQRTKPSGTVNVFAGIPAPVKHPIDLDLLISNRIFVFGTSGSLTRDMRLVLQKVMADRLDTNASVGAVTGMAGATDGLAAVENRLIDGKVIVYPQLHTMPLIRLKDLAGPYPTVAALLKNGLWTAEAEQELLKVGQSSPEEMRKVSLLETGKNVIRMETEAVAKVEKVIGDEFYRVVEMMLGCTGRVITTGMGKAGLIGRKVAATLASTGTPSFFVHPAESVHGDLGMVTADDVVLAFSHRGQTDEVLRILPIIKGFGASLVAVTSNAESDLARLSDLALVLDVPKEACPMNLAPTSSTTAMLALGDALAMTLLEARGFGPEDYALRHPGGSLGRRLLTKVKDIMHSGEDNPVVQDNVPLQEAILVMTRSKLAATSVVDASGKLVGFFTDGDLRRYLLSGSVDLSTPISALMTKSPKVVQPEQMAVAALQILRQHKIIELPVVDGDGHPIGMVHMHDIDKAGIS